MLKVSTQTCVLGNVSIAETQTDKRVHWTDLNIGEHIFGGLALGSLYAAMML